MSSPTEPASDIPTLVARVRDRRDEDAARRLVDGLYPLVIRIVRRHLPRRSAEEDLAQEVFMKMFARIEQWRAEVPFEHWVSRVAVTTCLDALRHQKRRPEVRWSDLSEGQAAVLDNVLHDESGTDAADASSARELAHQLLASLNPADRLVLTMMDMEGRSVADVQAVTGWSGTLVKVRAFRARRKLRKHLELLESNHRP